MSRAATSRLKVNPPIGSLPVLQYCAPEQLRIDESYQRSLETGPSQTLIRRIAMFWDWTICQPLIVARRADGGLYVVDGQHRLAAAKLRGDIWQLPCVVSSYRNAEEEAASFVALNQQRRPLSALNVFQASLVAGDETARTVAALIAEAGLSIAPHQNYISWRPGMISNVPGVVSCLRAHGPNLTRRALQALSSGFEGQILRFGGTLFNGISGFLAEERGAGRPVDADLLAMVLAGQTQPDWTTEINLEAVAEGVAARKVAGRVVAKAYREAAAEMDEAA